MSEAGHWGGVIRDLRVEHGFSQRQLAVETGIERGLLRRIEGGERARIEVIERLLGFFGYEIDAIKVGPSPEPPQQPKPKAPRPRNSRFKGLKPPKWAIEYAEECERMGGGADG